MIARRLFSTIGRRSPAFLKPRFQTTQAAKPTPAPKAAPESSSNTLLYTVIFAALAGGGYYYYTEQNKPVNYQEVYNAIAEVLENNDYDDGSYGPVLVRLAWHAAGTYDVKTGTGGSNGATMRFAPESAHGANAGLGVARDLLEPIKKKFPKISYSDLWSLAGVAAIQEMGGPTIKWRPGRSDAVTAEACTPDGRLPDASKTHDHLRSIFYRMGFNDQEIVTLSGAHALGRCHTDRSGFDGPWTFAPTTFSNEYFKLLLSERWVAKKWAGPFQYVDNKTSSLMMLPSDLALINDKSFRKYVDLYAKDQSLFFKDFAATFQKLEELGVPFKPDTPVKPDGVERGLVGEIIKRFESKGYKLVALQLMHPTKEHLEEHYGDLKTKSFFPKLVAYMLSGPVVGMVWEGKDAVKTGRKLLGETNPLNSAPGTIRGDFCIDVGKNLCHGSDAVESAQKEIALWFPQGVKSVARGLDRLIYE
ncbi:heme peroxidase [Boothiomyces sp. JEL0838]|nr:heme peroxidase [Boothiomyces sp. JEL0838]